MAEALRRSGETPAAFARRHGLQEERVRRWGRWGRTAAGRAGVAFAPVRVVTAEASAALEVAVGGAVVRVKAGFDAALLRQVVGALGGGAC
jgi:hypothetical protein